MSDFNHIHKSIDRALENAPRIDVDVLSEKWILFSDHHRGRRDGADDFLICEPAYKKALNYYHAEGYNLALLGDVEEFWENPFYMVINRYRELLQMEQRFFNDNRLYRLWGNHDDQWRYGAAISKHLGWLFPKIQIHEAIQLVVNSGRETLGQILLIHGHQGNLESDRYAWLSKIFVRYIWRNIQRIFKIPLTTPSNDLSLRSKHDRAMYNWAKSKENQILICGHTHQAVFQSKTQIDKLREELINCEREIEEGESDRKDLQEKRTSLKTKIEFLKSIETEFGEEQGVYEPRYFNTGCCSFADGDITGIELVDGRIMLVKWPGGGKQPKKILQSASLKRSFEK